MTGQSATGALERARTLCDLNRFDEAVKAAAQALAANPHDADAWCVMARAMLGQGDASTALDSAGRAIRLEPEEEWGHRIASAALSQLGRHQEALVEAIEAARLEPFLWQTHARVAYASLQARSLGQARAAARQAVELAPNEPDTWNVVGVVAATAHEFDDAEAAYRRALELDPNDSSSHDGLARLHLMRGRGRPSGLASAMTGFATAMRLDPTSNDSREALEVAIRSFLSIMFVCVWVDVFLVARLTLHSDAIAARAVPVLLLAVPLGIAVRFLKQLTPSVRAHLWRVLSRGWAAVASAGFVLCVALLVASAAFASESMRAGFTLGAAGAALLARLAIWRDLNAFHLDRAPASRGMWVYRSVLWWSLAVVASLLALFGVVGLFADGGINAVKITLVGAAIAAPTWWWIRFRASRRRAALARVATG